MADTTTTPTWPALTPDHPLSIFLAALPPILSEASYSEVYGITLDPSGPFHTLLILQKFLRANANDVDAAKKQLLETLKWRKEFKPLEAMKEGHDEAKFAGLGYVTVLEGVPGCATPSGKEVVTFNVYGAVKDNEATFGDLDSFLRWRVGIMELTLAQLDLSSATTPIPDYAQGPDPYQAIQIHDYLHVSFLRMNPLAKAASQKTIALFQAYYPETLSRKFFVNVPVLMGWVFGLVKMVASKETVRKFQVMSWGSELVGELGECVPKVYGGKGADLEVIGKGLKMVSKDEKAVALAETVPAEEVTAVKE